MSKNKHSTRRTRRVRPKPPDMLKLLDQYPSPVARRIHLTLDYPSYLEIQRQAIMRLDVVSLTLLKCDSTLRHSTLSRIFPCLIILRLTWPSLLDPPTALPVLPTLRRLSLDRMPITVIRDYPALQTLECLFCSQLTSITGVAAIEELDVVGSPLLTMDIDYRLPTVRLIRIDHRVLIRR